jgi:hypothetical protein
MQIYIRKKLEVTVKSNIEQQHNIIHGIFIIIFTNISKQEPSRHSDTPLGCLGLICNYSIFFRVKFIKKLSNGLIDIQLIVPPNFFEF